MPDDSWVPTLIKSLRSAIGLRTIRTGEQALKQHHHQLADLQPTTPGVWELADLLARWIDVNSAYAEAVHKLVEELGNVSDPSLLQLAHLEVAKGFLARYDHANDSEKSFTFALDLIERIKDQTAKDDLRGTSMYFLARLHRRQQHNEKALNEARSAQECAPSDHRGLKALIGITEAWLLFQGGDVDAGQKVLDAAYEVLGKTNDNNSKAGIHAIRARLAGRRREDGYRTAIELFKRAIGLYRTPDHRSRTRSLINLAFLLRLRALEVAGVGRRGNRGDACQALRDEAGKRLSEAKDLYGKPTGPHRGLGMISVNLAYLSLDEASEQAADRHTKEGLWALRESLQTAGTYADQASKWAAIGGSTDYVLMTRAEILRCIICYKGSQFFEGVREGINGAEKSFEHAERAFHWLTVAKIAKGRLVARAHAWLGLSLLLARQDIGAAERQLELAGAQITKDDLDYVYDEVRLLRSEIDRLKAKTEMTPLVKLMRGDVARPLGPLLADIERRIVLHVRETHGGVTRGAVARTAEILAIGRGRVYKNCRAAHKSAPPGGSLPAR